MALAGDVLVVDATAKRTRVGEEAMNSCRKWAWCSGMALLITLPPVVGARSAPLPVAPDVALLAVAAGQGTVKGRPNDPYRPLTDWSRATSIAEIPAEDIAYFATTYAKVIAVSGSAEPDRLVFRVRLANDLQTQFDAQPLHTAQIPYGVWFAFYLDTRGRSPANVTDHCSAETDLEAKVSGSTGSHGTYGLSGWYAWTDKEAKDQPAVLEGRLEPGKNLSYGNDVVEFSLPRAVLPAHAADTIRVVVCQSVEVGDREAAILQGRLKLR